MKRIADWWFEPAPAARLSALRMVSSSFVLYTMWAYWSNHRAIAKGALDTFRPIGVLRWMDAPLSLPAFDAFHTVTFVLGVAYFFGFAFRVTGPLFAATCLAFFTYRTSWMMIYHADNLFCLHILCIALGPSASAWAVDAWLERRGWLRWLRWGPQPDSSFGWVIKLVGMVSALTYLLAGIAKVMGESGVGWGSGQNLLDQIGNDAIFKALVSTSGPPPHVGWLYQHNAWLVGPAILTLVVELGAPLALLHPWLGRLWAFGIWSMHIGIKVMMGIVFPYPVSGMAYASFFPLEKVLEGGESLVLAGLRRVRGG